MQQRLGMIKALFARNRTHAETADVFDAAVLDQMRDDVKGLADIFAVLLLEIRNRTGQLAPGRDFAR